MYFFLFNAMLNLYLYYNCKLIFPYITCDDQGKHTENFVIFQMELVSNGRKSNNFTKEPRVRLKQINFLSTKYIMMIWRVVSSIVLSFFLIISVLILA